VLHEDITTVQKNIAEPIYREFAIPRKKGKMRTIQAPADDLKRIQEKINLFLQAIYECIAPACAKGFRKNFGHKPSAHSIIENAAQHLNKTHLLNIDIKDFFASVTDKKVLKLFRSKLFHWPENIAQAMTLLVTYKNMLPTGSPCSPVISNLICLSLDAELMKLSDSYHITYTRYADDLSFSGMHEISKDFLKQVESILQENGFQVNTSKIRWQTKHQKQKVTGIKVNNKLNVERTFYRNLRAMIHSLEKEGEKKAAAKHFGKESVSAFMVDKFICKINGMLSFMKSVRGEKDALYRRLKRKWREQEKRMEEGISFSMEE
jgi:RNA-directed DNA polymerase